MSDTPKTRKPHNDDAQRGSAEAALDPERPRSLGPLHPDELAFCRDAGIPLAYDPVQIGWVTADCEDDFALDEPTATDTARLERLLIERANRRMPEATGRATDRSALASEIWALASDLVRDLDELETRHRLAALRRLQARAHAFVSERIARPRDRARRRHAALVSGQEYILRAWRPTETKRFRVLLDDPAVWTHLPEAYPNPLTEEMARDLIALSNAAVRHEVRAVERDGEVIGQVRLLFDSPHGTVGVGAVDAEISYWLGRSYWGQGHASALIPLFTLLAFQRHPLASIFARVAPGNVASHRALERAGYLDEGDLAADVASDDGTRTLRCYRAEYLEPG